MRVTIIRMNKHYHCSTPTLAPYIGSQLVHRYPQCCQWDHVDWRCSLNIWIFAVITQQNGQLRESSAMIHVLLSLWQKTQDTL